MRATRVSKEGQPSNYGARSEQDTERHDRRRGSRFREQGTITHTFSTTGSESVWPMVMWCRNAIRQQRGYQWGGGVVLSWKWAEKGGQAAKDPR
jgi:hypothetical protein